MAFVSTTGFVAGTSRRAACTQKRAQVVVANTEEIRDKIAAAVKEASEKSEKFGKASNEAAVAWDIVEELSAELSHEKVKNVVDPLEAYCEDAPEADECRTYED